MCGEGGAEQQQQQRDGGAAAANLAAPTVSRPGRRPTESWARCADPLPLPPPRLHQDRGATAPYQGAIQLLIAAKLTMQYSFRQNISDM